MFKSKSFDLINEDDIKKSESSNKYGWLRCLILPALIAFILTLILVNVDFSGEKPENTSTETEALLSTFITDAEIPKDSEQTNEFDHTIKILFSQSLVYDGLTEDVSTETEMSTKSSEPQRKSLQRSLVKAPLNDICHVMENDCTLKCTVNNVKDLNKRLEDQYKQCQADMDITIQASTLSTLGKDFLSGNFRLKTLFISECSMFGIDNNAFNKQSLSQSLQKLIISGSSVTKMTAQTFAGLNNLGHFEMSNGGFGLEAKQFLTPMATTLTKFIFKSPRPEKPDDPTPWLDAPPFVKLIEVDLSGNNFLDTLKRNTFEKLVGVEKLKLNNCRIRSFEDGTFSQVKSSLLLLDLSNNQMKTLSPDFFRCMSDTKAEISLAQNEWDCSCKNNDFVENMKNSKILFAPEPKCFTPNNGVPIKSVNNCCQSAEECAAKSTEAPTTETTITPDRTDAPTTITPASTYTTDTTDTTLTPTIKPPENNEIALVCKSSTNDSQFIVPVQDRYIVYTVRRMSSTSVAIELRNNNEFQLIYYLRNNNESVITIPITENSTVINNLIAYKEYVFCGVMPGETSISPFNCHSHHTGIFTNGAWLTSSDMPLFVSLTIFSIVFCVFLGAVIVFLTLRWRPTLLKGSKRLFQFSAYSKQVFLTKEKTALSTEELYEALRTYGSFYNKPMANLNQNDYLQYIRNMDAIPTIYSGINFSENLPPSERAPAMPPVNTKRQLSEQSTIPANDISSLESITEVAEEHEYQSLDQYQQISEVNSTQKIE